METVWSRGGWVTVTDIVQQMGTPPADKPPVYSTVKSVMQNLADKGHLRKRSAGRANEFNATRSREAFQQSMIADVVRPLLKTQRNPLLAHIAGELAADDESYAEFERLLKEKRAERSRG